MSILPGSMIPTPPPTTSVSIGPITNFLLLLWLIAILKKLGIIPEDKPDGDFASTAFVLSWVAANRPARLTETNIWLARLQTQPITVSL